MMYVCDTVGGYHLSFMYSSTTPPDRVPDRCVSRVRGGSQFLSLSARRRSDVGVKSEETTRSGGDQGDQQWLYCGVVAWVRGTGWSDVSVLGRNRCVCVCPSVAHGMRRVRHIFQVYPLAPVSATCPWDPGQVAHSRASADVSSLVRLALLCFR